MQAHNQMLPILGLLDRIDLHLRIVQRKEAAQAAGSLWHAGKYVHRIVQRMC